MSQTQRTLFDTANLARRRDPPTSQQAAEQIEPHLGRCQAAMLAAFRMYGPATAQEAAQAAATQVDRTHNPETYRKRVHELVGLGKLEQCGTRMCNITKRNAMVWRVTTDA